jgi:hypothetical protein
VRTQQQPAVDSLWFTTDSQGYAKHIYKKEEETKRIKITNKKKNKRNEKKESI